MGEGAEPHIYLHFMALGGWSLLCGIRSGLGLILQTQDHCIRCILGYFPGSAIVDGKLSLGSELEICSVPIFPQCYPYHQL